MLAARARGVVDWWLGSNFCFLGSNRAFSWCSVSNWLPAFLFFPPPQEKRLKLLRQELPELILWNLACGVDQQKPTCSHRNFCPYRQGPRQGNPPAAPYLESSSSICQHPYTPCINFSINESLTFCQYPPAVIFENMPLGAKQFVGKMSARSRSFTGRLPCGSL